MWLSLPLSSPAAGAPEFKASSDQLNAVHSHVDCFSLLHVRRLAGLVGALRAAVQRVNVRLELTVQIERRRADGTLVREMCRPQIQFMHLRWDRGEKSQ